MELHNKIKNKDYVSLGLGGHVSNIEIRESMVDVTIEHVGGITTCSFNSIANKYAMQIRKGKYAFVEVKCDIVNEEDLKNRLTDLENQLENVKQELEILRECKEM